MKFFMHVMQFFIRHMGINFNLSQRHIICQTGDESRDVFFRQIYLKRARIAWSYPATHDREEFVWLPD